MAKCLEKPVLSCVLWQNSEDLGTSVCTIWWPGWFLTWGQHNSAGREQGFLFIPMVIKPQLILNRHLHWFQREPNCIHLHAIHCRLLDTGSANRFKALIKVKLNVFCKLVDLSWNCTQFNWSQLKRLQHFLCKICLQM